MDSSTSSASSFQIIQSLALPLSGQAAAGPIHTIVEDAAGNLYYSDEVNHSVVSLNEGGGIRWQRTQHGNAMGEFHYPRGLSLGRIEKDGHALTCLAIADSWNRRVQFLDLAGHPVGSWTQAGQAPFVEVADVRFIAGELNPDGTARYEGFWLVLDKGDHRLSGLGPDGQLLFQIGRCFPPTMEGCWAVPPMLIEKVLGHPEFTEKLPLFDFTFYPERILGDSEHALYLWEPHTGRLKQILVENLFPILINTEEPMEWIAADALGILGWHRPTGRLIRYDCYLDLCYQVEIHGEPIPSDLPTTEFWVQREEHIERGKWSAPDPESVRARLAGKFAPLTRTVESEIKLFDTDRAQRAVADLAKIFDEGLALVDEIKLLDGGDLRMQPLQDVLERLQAHPQKRGQPVQDLHEALHHWCLGLVEYHQISSDNERLAQEVVQARNQWNACAGPIRDRFSLIMSRFKDLYRMHMNMSGTIAPDTTYTETWKQAALSAELDLQRVADWIGNWTEVT